MNQVMSRYHCLPHQVSSHRLPPTPPPTFGRSPTTPTSPLDFTDRIPFAELRLSNEKLGSGSFGTVLKGRWRGKKVAVKQFKTREEIDSFLVEVKQLSCVKHTNIVTLYGSSTTTHSAFLIMEYAEGGSLNHLLHECRHQEYDLRHACSWAMQTARGVAYLHGIKPKPIMHRDLKPANLLLFSHGKILKICDFGTACAVKTQMTNNTGSASYMAPEVFASSSYLESGDVFSWSIIFWELLVRMQPYTIQQYSNPFSILWKVTQGVRPNEIESCPEPIWNLITRSWNKNAKERPSMLQVAEEMEIIFSLTEKARQQTTTLSNNGSVIVYAKNSPIARNSLGVTPTDNRNQKQQQQQQASAIYSQFDRNDHHFNQPQHHQVNSTISSQASTGMKLQNQLHHQHLYGQHHEFEYLQQRQYLRQQQSIHSQLRVLHRKKALESHIQGLMEKSKQLEALCSNKAAGESFKEFEDIKIEIKKIKDIIDKNNSIGTRSSSGSAQQQLVSPHHHHQDIDMKRAC